MGKLNGKVAVITGASKGIGAGIAKRLALAGASVIVNYASSKNEADQVVTEIKANEGTAVAVQADVSKATDIKKLFQETIKAFGKLDILINNAGYYGFAPIEEFTEEQIHKHFNLNVIGLILTIQEAIKHFGPNGGNIINISSIVSTNPLPMAVVYSSTKGAVDNLTRGLALELANKKIRVNAIAPGATDTPGTSTVSFFDGDGRKQIIASTPLGRLGQPDDMGAVATFLASDDSAWITGETIRVAGGKI